MVWIRDRSHVTSSRVEGWIVLRANLAIAWYADDNEWYVNHTTRSDIQLLISDLDGLQWWVRCANV
jgi:hypothetical protein